MNLIYLKLSHIYMHLTTIQQRRDLHDHVTEYWVEDDPVNDDESRIRKLHVLLNGVLVHWRIGTYILTSCSSASPALNVR